MIGRRLTFALLALLLGTSIARSQNVGIGTNTPDASALVDMSSTSMGLLIPRITNAGLISSPANGLLIFNSTLNTFYYNAGTAGTPNWLPFLTSSSGWALTGNASTNPGTNFLGTTDAQALVFKTNGTERMRILSGGNVGIGVAAPGSPLEVGGDVRLSNTGTASAIRFYEPSASGTNYSAFKARAQTADISYTLPDVAPTANQVLAAGSSTPTDLVWANAGASLWAAGAGASSLIGSGTGNTAAGNYAISAGQSDAASGANSVAIGGYSNTASGTYSTVSGGQSNTANVSNATVSGGYNNTASGLYATVSGGQSSTASGQNAVIGGGNNNQATTLYSTISGGSTNTVNSTGGSIGGGASNSIGASAIYGTVSGGLTNAATSNYATVAGGQSNTASNIYAAVVGGLSGTASGQYATVLGGQSNTVSGNYSLAFGLGANVTQSYSVIFNSTGTPMKVGIGLNAPSTPLDVSGDATLSNSNNVASTLFFKEPSGSGSNYSSFKAGAQATDIAYTLPTTAPTVDQVLFAGSVTPTNLTWGSLASKAWMITGNSGTTAGTNYIGTSDNQDLVIKTNATENVRVKSGGNVGINTNSPNTKVDINGDLAFRYTGYSASNGTNNNIAVGSYSFARITGPGSSFTITGISGGQDGKLLVLYNATSQSMTIANDNSSSTASNRIYTLSTTGTGDISIPGKGSITLLYSAADSRWLTVAPPTSSTSVAPYEIKRKTADESVTSSTTLQDDDDLYFDLAANQVMEIDGFLDADCSSSGPDIVIAFSAPSGATLDIGYHCSWNGNTNANINIGTLTSSGTASPTIQLNGTNSNPIFVHGIIANGSTAGTLHLQFAQHTSSGTAVKLLTNSFLKATTVQ